MRALCEALDHPERRFRSLHVVGTNGKSSVTAMAASVLGEVGLRTGSCLSPHVWRWSERIRIGGEEIAPAPFAAAIERVAAAIPAVEAGLADSRAGWSDEPGGSPERVTQFEAAIAASFVALADAGVDIAVVEAGLGGRLDATNVIPSEATALSSVSLDHVEWLGGSELEIATEKLAVLRPGTTLVLGDVSEAVAELARRTASERGARVIQPVPSDDLPPAQAPYLARNAAVALTLAETVSGPIAADRARSGLAGAALPGRAELIPGDPPMLADAAHNEEGAQALAEALPGLARGRPVIACLSVLDDKDRAGIAAALAPAVELAVCTAAEPRPAMGRPGARAADPGELARTFAAAGVDSEAISDPATAIDHARAIARRRAGVALCAGSHYLLRYAWTVKRAQSSSR